MLYNHEASKSLACQTSFFAGNDFAQQAKYDRGNLVFVPPVYVQRYEAVSLILQREPWKGQIRKVLVDTVVKHDDEIGNLNEITLNSL